MTIAPLSEDTFLQGIHSLAKQDADLANVVDRLGYPPFWTRQPGFASLVHIILEQQVSLASARAAFDRLLAAASPLTPHGFLRLDDQELRAIGFSRQKASYARGLSLAVVNGDLDLVSLETLDDASARDQLLQLKGIGPWTADIYLLMALRRPDIWPVGDLALVSAVRDVKQLDGRPESRNGYRYW